MYSIVFPRLCTLSKQTLRISISNVRNFTFVRICAPIELYQHSNPNLLFYRNKSKSKNKQSDKKMESESEEEEEDEDLFEEIIDKNTKVLKASVNSLRTDLILKMGLGMARNKIETLFYESKIRVNGRKVFKKSEHIEPGDEIDIVKGVSANNPNLLVVARVEVLSADGKGDKIGVKLRRTKSLIIENYEDPWKGNTIAS